MSPESVFFLSDAHFRSRNSGTEQEKLRRFRAFLEKIEGAGHLYLLGDIFDFWFEYRRVLPKGYGEVLFPLRRLRDSGTGLTFIGGNHDYWLGSFLRDELGAEIAPDGCRVEEQGKQLLLLHGDELLSGDWSYKMLKSLIRNPLFISASRLLHPDFTFWAADRLADSSRLFGRPASMKRDAKKSLRLKPLLDEDVDAILFGHLHLAFHWILGGKEMVCLGDWIQHFSHAELQGGVLSLKDAEGRLIEKETAPEL